MINFFTETEFTINEDEINSWLLSVIASEDKNLGEINYIFCDDAYLLSINQQYLDHDTYTDIISFDTSEGNDLSGDIFISVERIKENAQQFNVSVDDELKRVLAHGILHFCGYKDKTDDEAKLMREKEDEKLKMFHVEQ
ncbi:MULTISPECIES: rRNA maturation RNase YbeY [Croceibacter]|jgi:rRNA maturation RNase YbeY|uniref:rRNA maturation RNase YbeY n=1 Tax=Croceibacter TaxID=216431 RepID=UPI000C650D7F|nr:MULTISPECIES: rRNA maturation RNase YbeY [Croceibacter]MBG25284.1 rRNA maturation RNase YbeY [Croceibacter sp.]|tara:strand:+ start:953 stop:1369 length:417 start_codon:yes stop_codon:yes gene_type:complete